jgi:hypothetical protein
MSHKPRANITAQDIGQLYRGQDGKVYELIDIESEPRATMKPLQDDGDFIKEYVSFFSGFVQLIPLTEVARRKKVVAQQEQG